MPRRGRARTLVLWTGVIALLGSSVLLAGCSDTKRKPKAVDVRAPRRDVPRILDDTIGAQATLSGMEPVFCSGYGLVVGLNGTGSVEIPINVRTVMEDEMAKLGVGRGDGPLSKVTPGELIRDKNTAVVLVQAVIPPAAPDGERFDVKVQSLPGTAVTSLEGGRLYTANLYQGLITPGGPARDPVAKAYGDVFINPFVDPAETSRGGGTGIVDKTVGRVLDGGYVNTRFRPLLILDSPSHTRARAVAAAINERFPQGSNLYPPARGMNDESIEINITRAWASRSTDFFKIVEHLRVDRAFPEDWARRFSEALKEMPDLADDLKWCLVALGDVSIPFARSLYNYGERVPRLAAIEVGARLGDPLSRPPLEEIILDGPTSIRTDSVRLLASLPTDPRVDAFLLDLLDSSDLDIRIAAYEGLDARMNPRIERKIVDGKFRLDIVPSSQPMVYVTLQGLPKIVLFGDLMVQRPTFVAAWDGRLLVSSQGPTDQVRTFYRDYKTTQTSVQELDAPVADLIEYFAHNPTPEQPQPGLNFSYSETVGALYEIIEKGGLGQTVFVPETDRLALELLRSEQQGDLIIRPELSEDEEWDPSELDQAESLTVGAPDEADTEPDPDREERRSKYVVPLGGSTEGSGTK